jgi:hypothetical protein
MDTNYAKLMGTNGMPQIPQQMQAQGMGQQQAQPQQDNESWWKKLLPMAGGILGGLVPIPGLDVLASGAGAAAGKALENSLTGKKVLQGNVLTSGLENAAMTGMGSLVGGLGGAVAGKAADVAGTSSEKLIAGQASKGLIPPELANELRTVHEVTDLNQGANLARVYTGNVERELASGGNGALLTRAYEDGVQQFGNKSISLDEYAIKPVRGAKADLANAGLSAQNNPVITAAENNGLTEAQTTQLRSNVSAARNAANNPDGSANPLTMLRQIRQKASESWDTFKETRSPDAKNLASAYDQVAEHLNGKIGIASVPVPPEVQTSLANDILENAGKINPKSAQAMATAVQKEGLTYGDLNSLQSPFVQVSKAVNKTANTAAKNFGASTSDVLRGAAPLTGAVLGGPKGAAAGLGAALTSSSAVDKGGASMLNKISNILGGNQTPKVIKALSKGGAEVAANLPNLVTDNSTGAGAMNQGATGGGGGMGAGGAQSPYSSLLQNLIAQAILAPQLASNTSPILSAMVPGLQKATMAGPLLGAQQQQLQSAGGPQGMAGILSRLTGVIPGTPQNTLNASTSNLSSLLGIPSAALPNVMQSQGTAGIQSNALQTLLSQLGGY